MLLTSGVGGGIVAEVSRQLGIGVVPPRPDAVGKSYIGNVRGGWVLHAFDSTNQGSSFLRSFARDLAAEG